MKWVERIALAAVQLPETITMTNSANRNNSPVIVCTGPLASVEPLTETTDSSFHNHHAPVKQTLVHFHFNHPVRASTTTQLIYSKY